jgi:RNA polymerase sigma-70 factor (ECF subfamily)
LDRVGRPSARAGAFATTQWSIVAAARDASTESSRAALAVLCERYWFPLYAYARRRGRDADDARDLTQAFFATLLEKHGIRGAAPDRGRFRSYLLGAFKHFLADEYDRAHALKRGGRLVPVSLDAAESLYAAVPQDERTPDRVYERRWAVALLDRVLARLGEELAETGQAERFELLKGFLTGDPVPYAEVAAQLGTSEGAAKVAVHRLRGRYRELLRAEIADTLADPADVDDEIRYLLAALGA